MLKPHIAGCMQACTVLRQNTYTAPIYDH